MRKGTKWSASGTAVLALSIGLLVAPAPTYANSLPGSTFMAGYQTPVNVSVANHIQAQLVVPAITCPSNLGFDNFTAAVGFFPKDQWGVAAYVALVCHYGTPSYSVGAVFSKTEPGTMTIVPGDKVFLEITQPALPTSADSHATIKDLTTGAVEHFSGITISGDGDQAGVGSMLDALPNGYSGAAGLATFKALQWASISLNTQAYGTYNPSGSNGVNRHGTVDVYTSPLSPAGASFKNTAPTRQTTNLHSGQH